MLWLGNLVLIKSVLAIDIQHGVHVGAKGDPSAAVMALRFTVHHLGAQML